MMRTKLFRTLLCLAVILLTLLPLTPGTAAAEESGVRYTNPETGYRVMILDDDDLLTDAEESKLTEEMTPITAYGHIIFWSTSEYASDEIAQAKNKRYALCGNESSGILAVNMNVRYITFQSDGSIYSMVSSSYARSITDNVSGYASSGAYYRCAAEAFEQVYQVLQGNRIAEPMKVISYVVIGLMIAFVVVVGVVFGKRFNPLIKKNDEKARMLRSGELMTSAPTVTCVEVTRRGWVTVLLILLRIIAAGGGGGGGGGGRSGGGGGGGGGGSSRF